MNRCTFRPQSCSAALLNRSCENGIHSSAVQPCSSTLVRACHTGSNPSSKVALVVCGMEAVEADAGRGDAEHVGRAPVVKRVERHQDVLGLLGAVAPAHRRLDRRPRRLVHPRADVERRRVVDEADLHPLGRRRALDRLLLDEVVDRRRLFPQRLVEPAVHAHGAFTDANRRRVLGARGGGVLGQRPGRGRERRGERDGGGNRGDCHEGDDRPRSPRSRGRYRDRRASAGPSRGRRRHDAVCLRNPPRAGARRAIATASRAQTRRRCSGHGSGGPIVQPLGEEAELDRPGGVVSMSATHNPSRGSKADIP